ncbi:unnamed protein product [Meloidogyne enterolobii]|uniref:Uncharacterized protein n=1 Tax=Meloidogyne enterolobii TaxID=390850 RepID=A0ACB1A1H9_MELEN
MSGISPYSLNPASTKALIQENKTTKTSTIFSAPSVKINTSKLVEMSSNVGGSSSNNSSNSSSPIIIQTSINSQSSKNISTTTCGSLTTAPKIVFTLKPAPISSVVGGVGIMDNNNKSIRTTISSSSASPAITTTSSTQIQPPPLCITPPKNNKKSPIKRPNQLIAPTTTSNNLNLFEDSSKMSCSSSINSNQFSSSSPLLDSNDLLTNTVNKVASGADISPTNLEESTSTKALMSSTLTSSTTTNLPLTKPKQPKKKAPIKPKILVDEQRKNPVKIQPAVAVPCISPQIFGASPPQAQIASIPLESNVVADTTPPTAASICNSNGQQTFPSTGMLLPSNSQFALASNGNLFSNYGTNFQPSSAAPIGNVSGQQQQPQQFVQIMPQQIFFSPVQQIDSSGQLIQQQTFDQSQQQQNQQVTMSSSPTKIGGVAPPQTLTTANLMTARNLFFHTGNGMFMPISNPNIIGIPQSQQPQQQTFLPITSTNLTPISSASSKFVVLASKPSGGTTTMPNILPKISSRGRTSTTTATIVSSITTNTTATPSGEITVSSTPSIQQSSNIMLTNQQHGENIFYGNSSPHAQYLHQVFMLQQKQQQGNLYISNNNSVDVGEKKIELGKGGQQQQTKPTRVRKKKGSGDILTADNETQKHPKIPHFDGTIILHQQGQQHGQQQQGFDEEENEPPPVLCRGGEITSEPPSSGSGTKSIENVFQKEAKIIREKMFDSNGKKYGPLVHDIDGFKIEEDVEPFPCEHQKLLEKLVIDENVINQRKNKNDATTATTNENGNEEKEEKSLSTSNKNNSSSSAESNTSSSKSKKRQRKQSTSSSEGGVGKDNSSSFSKSPPNRKLKKMSSSKIEDKPPKGRRRELENLLKMDFGPGKTPFQTSDPDEYAEEVLGGRKRTLALAAEEKSARKSLDRPGSSSKKHDKEKSFSLTSTTSATSNEKPDKNEPRRSDESLEEGCCSYCRRRFSEVGRDKEHEQYCSKECRRMKKYAKKQQQQQKAALLLNEGNTKASSSLIGNEKNASTTTSQEINNSATSKIRSSSIQSPPTTNNNSSTPDANKTKTSTAKIMTSPLGSAFSTLQPQSIATNNTTAILSNNKWPGTTIPTTNLNEQIACLAKGFEVQSSSSSGDEQPQVPRPYGAPFNFLPTSLFASQFLPPQSQAFLSGQGFFKYFLEGTDISENKNSFLQWDRVPIKAHW